MKHNGISRRNFLKGAAGGAVGLAALNVFHKFSSPKADIISDPAPVVKSAPSWLEDEPEITEEEITEIIETEAVPATMIE